MYYGYSVSISGDGNRLTALSFTSICKLIENINNSWVKIDSNIITPYGSTNNNNGLGFGIRSK